MFEYTPVNCDIINVIGWVYDHFAIVYLERGPWVYEAWPPEVHKIPLDKWLSRWDSWLFRKTKPQFAVMRKTPLLTIDLATAMYLVAVERLGTPYNWLWNYVWKLKMFDQCAEFIVWQQKAIGVTCPVEPSRVTPEIFRKMTLESGLWEKCLRN